MMVYLGHGFNSHFRGKKNHTVVNTLSAGYIPPLAYTTNSVSLKIVVRTREL